MPTILSGTDGSPLRNAIRAASAVICLALVVYAAAAAADDWPALVMASLGAALGAGFTINALVARDLDGDAGAAAIEPRSTIPSVVVHQLLCVAIPSFIAWAGRAEDPRWLIGAVALGPLWAWTLSTLVDAIERTGTSVRDIYPRAYQIAALSVAMWFIYGAIAADTPWLWRPTKWDDYQAPLWFVVLEFVSLPLTLAAMKARN
jgi:hypothetical protein